MKKYIIILLSMFMEAYAQNPSLNHSKYWFYRYRLRNEFLALGEDPCGMISGKMIPAGTRYTDYSSIDNGQRTNKPNIKIGDGTSYLGYYLAVLASEYALMKRSNKTQQPQLDSLKKELYWAMKAYERLDRNVEAGDNITPNGMPLGNCNDDQNVNGFFLREDVGKSTSERMRRNYFEKSDGTKIPIEVDDPTFFEEQYPGHNEDKGFNNKSLDNQTCEYKESILWGTAGCGKETNGQNYNSPDQMANLLVGFAYVVKLMGNESYMGYNFKQMAKHYCRRMGEYFDRDDVDWSGRVPGTNRVARFSGGFEMMPLTYAFSRAIDVITEERWGHTGWIPKYKYSNNVPNLSPTAWASLAYPAGAAMYNKNFSVINNGSGDYTNAVLSQPAVVGNSWAEGLIPIHKTLTTLSIPYPCNMRTCGYTCLIEHPFNNRCVLGFSNVCIDKCTQDIELNCYTYQISTNLALLLQAVTTGADLLNSLSKVIGVDQTTLINAVLMNLNDIGFCNPIPLPNLTVNTTGLSLSEYGYKTHTELFVLEHKLLHDLGPYTYGTGNIQEYLNSAPCSGPHYQPYFDPHNFPNQDGEKWSNSKGVYGWRNSSRFEQSNTAFREGKYEDPNCTSCSQHPKSHWGGPGLDYMLLHNTYYLLHGQDADLNNLANEHHKYVSGTTYPLPDGSGSTTRKLVENGFETLNILNSTVASNGNVEFRSGLGNKVSGNVKFAAGSNVKLSQKYEYPCNINSGQYSGLTYNTSGARREVLAPDYVDSAAAVERFKQKTTNDLQSQITKVGNGVIEARNKNPYTSISDFISKNPPAVAYVEPPLGILSVLPNPTSGPTAVTINSKVAGIGTIEVYDSYGLKKLSFSQSIPLGNYTWNISLGTLTPGLYNLVYQNGTVYSTKQFYKQ